MKNNLNPNSKKLLFSNILFRAWTLVSQIFLNIFLFKNTNDIKIIALFNIILLWSQLLSFSFFAKIVKYWYRNLLNIVSLLWLSIVYWFLVYLWNWVVDFYQFLAIWIWFFSWIYWIWYNNNEFDLTTIENRWNYQWLKKSLKTISSIILPSIIWIIIWINYLWFWYQTAFWIWILLFLISVVIWNIDINYINKNEKYSLFNALKTLLKDKNIIKTIANYSLLWFGLSNPLIETILPVLLFTYWIKEMDLWFLVSTFAIITVIASYLFWKFVEYKNYKMVYWLSWWIYILLVLILILYPSYWFIIWFASILNLLFTFMDVPQNVFSANIFNKLKWFEKIKSEYMVIREWPLMIWRILSFLCIYFIWSFDEIWIKILFWIMAWVIFLSTILFWQIT